ncbi:MAG: flagellar biosynthesis regulator FlaF [Pseudomonadota bacterium]
MSLKAYQRTQAATEKPRDAEYRLFSQVTRALLEADKTGRDDLSKLVDAVDWNRRLWSALASDCASSANGLPEQTRAQIISLSIWVSKYSSQVVRSKASVEPLVDINRTIMQGLQAAA